MFKDKTFEDPCTKHCRDAVVLARKLEEAEPTRKGSRSKLRLIKWENP